MDQSRGIVRCNKIIHFRSKGPESKVHPTIENFININVTTGSNSKWKKLSPMILGPLKMSMLVTPTDLYPDGIQPGYVKIDDKTALLRCTNLENLWQGSKVYDIDLDDNGNIKKSFFDRRLKMVNDPKPHRRSLPKSKGNILFLYWDNVRYKYLESRVIYCKIYELLVRITPEYKELVKLVDSGVNIQIVGYDGVDSEITEETMKYHYNDISKPFGQEFVLCCLLCGFAPWN